MYLSSDTSATEVYIVALVGFPKGNIQSKESLYKTEWVIKRGGFERLCSEIFILTFNCFLNLSLST